MHYAKYKSRKQSMSISFNAWILTDSSNEDVTTALVNPPLLMFERTGAPKPMEESCCLEKECTLHILSQQRKNFHKHTAVENGITSLKWSSLNQQMLRHK